jgi:hypothetical protein
MSKVNMLNLDDAVSGILNEYGDDVKDYVEDSINEVAAQSVQKLKSKTSGAGPWKKYPKTWTSKTEKERISVSATVYNRSHYQLTHLLEFGHAKQNGGRTRAFPHIAEVNDWAQSEVIKRIEEKV